MRGLRKRRSACSSVWRTGTSFRLLYFSRGAIHGFVAAYRLWLWTISVNGQMGSLILSEQIPYPGLCTIRLIERPKTLLFWMDLLLWPTPIRRLLPRHLFTRPILSISISLSCPYFRPPYVGSTTARYLTGSTVIYDVNRSKPRMSLAWTANSLPRHLPLLGMDQGGLRMPLCGCCRNDAISSRPRLGHAKWDSLSGTERCTFQDWA
jgi:hypothetical protein